MGPLDALWHLLNFVAPALGVGLITTALAKWLFRRELSGAAWQGLLLWSMGAGLVVLLAGLVAFGRDGRMATYGLLVAATALVLWWRGFVLRR
ncbi:MAG: hypothetical protein J0M20_10250 [Burkholderiales bacterium]|nr:hypothetical protein [Burkholderiales bacterium]